MVVFADGIAIFSGNEFPLRSHPEGTPITTPAKIKTNGLRLTHGSRRNNVAAAALSKRGILRNERIHSPLPHLTHHIDQRRLAAFYHLDRLSQRLDQIFGFDDRAGAPATVRPRHRAEVDVWIFDANSNGFVFH